MGVSKRPKLSTEQVGSAGEHFAAAEIHRRGAVTFSGSMHDIDLLASDASRDSVISIQVKTKTSGIWQTSTTKGAKPRRPRLRRSSGCSSISARSLRSSPSSRSGGSRTTSSRRTTSTSPSSVVHRAKNDASTHHAIPTFPNRSVARRGMYSGYCRKPTDPSGSAVRRAMTSDSLHVESPIDPAHLGRVGRRRPRIDVTSVTLRTDFRR